MDPIIETLLYICGIITSVAAAAAIVIKVAKKAIKSVTEETITKTISDSQKVLNEQIQTLNSQLQEYMKKQDESDERIRRSLLASTRDRINQAHDYYMNKEYIGAHSVFIIEELYSSYKELGGNSFIDRQMEDIRDLEVVSAETALK